MRRILSSLIPLSALLVFGAAAFGQYNYNSYYGQSYYSQDRALFEHARTDLDRASAYPYASRDDHKRFDDARTKLYAFQIRFDQGRYEKHQLDAAIDSILRVVRDNSLDPRDRGALDDDLRRMRDYREFRNHN